VNQVHLLSELHLEALVLRDCCGFLVTLRCFPHRRRLGGSDGG